MAHLKLTQYVMSNFPQHVYAT